MCLAKPLSFTKRNFVEAYQTGRYFRKDHFRVYFHLLLWGDYKFPNGQRNIPLFSQE